MMKNILHVILVNLLIYNIALAQSVTVLPGETSYDYSYVYSGDKNFAKNFCVYNKGKGMITIGFEVLNATSPNALYWDTTKIAFHYNGAWHSIGDFIAKTGSAPTNLKTSYSASNYYTTSYGTLSNGETHVTEAYAVGGGTHDIDVYLKNYNNLKVYDTTYLPIVSKANRLAPADNVNFSFQTQRYSSTYPSPVKNPSSSSGVSAVLEANDIPDQTYYSNLPGVYSTEIGTQRIIVVNITNLPPEMISSSGFRVHMYQHQVNAAFNDDRIFEWVYNNQNFMTNGPSSLSASTNSCSGVVLNWSNSQNSTPADGVTMVKTVILRDGAFLAMVNEGVNTYTDATALINTDYNYKVLHVAFSEFGDTYYKSPESSTVTGHKKPSPDEPISLTATNNNCASKVTLNWSYNGANPTSFYVATADSATATTWTTLAASLSGSARSYEHTSVTRGKEYFYRVYSINSCGDSSLTYASTSGISPNDPTPPTVIGTIVDAINGTITFKWKDNANNETKYEVIRQDDGGNTVYFDVNAQTGTGDTLSYVDNGVSSCTAYTYKVKAYNDCVLSGVSSTTGSTNQLPPPNLTNTFASPNFFKGSKGYYVNRVELQWTNNNNTVLDLIKIYRKELGSTNPAAQITSVTPGTELYVDNTADAGVFYEYSLVGVSYCLGATYYTDTIKDIGFRSATGIVNGHIEYSGGVAVKGVKVNLESANGTSGKSLKTSTGNYGAIPNSSDFAFANNFTFETYVKIPATTNNINIIQKSGAFGLTYSSSNQIQFLVNTGTATTLNVNSTIDDGTYHHLAGVYDGTYIKLYLDGLLTDSVAKTGNITTNTNNILLGNLTADTLFLDEVRFYNVAKTKQQISQDYSRVLRGNENGLIAYYRFNEGEGTAFYDISYHSGTVYNENHGYFIGAPKFTNSIPLAAQLSFAGYTNTNGDYTVNVAYNGIGEIFTATPQYLTHQFSPGSQSLFIGDNSQIQNGIDFTDISSFTVTGNVKYKDGSCPEEGVFLKIDGNVVIVNGMPVTTDASGNFNIQVPIGNHFVSVDRNQHIFSDGRWPITGTYDFQAPVSGLQFIDSTYVKVIGRVVGGTKESSKPMIPGRSNNNIGQATIQFNTLDGCNTNSLITNSVSGDYEVFLHPLKYTIPDFSTTNTSSPNFSTFSAAVFSNNQILDLSTIPPVQTIIDTLFTSADHSTWSSVDSVDYQVIRSWTYRNSPEIWITDTTWINYTETTAGDGELYYTDPVTDDKDTIVLPTKNALGFPIYHERRDYYVNIGVMEVYKDLALSTTDSVPVTSGNLLINNALAKTPVIAVSLSDTAVFKSWNKDTCYYRYHFVGGNPSIGYTAGDASNFSKQFTVQYAGGANTANWLPGGSVFKGIIIGGMSSDGQSFVTLGPEVPTMILRDPPGSASFSSLESGSTIVNTSSWSVAENLGASMAATIELGTEFTTGIGMEVETDVENSLTLGAEIESTITQSGNFSEAITLTEGWSTSPSTDFVGSDGDIYIGKSMNITFGMSRNIMLLKDSECSLSGIECRTEIITVAGEDYRIGKKSSLSAAPGGYATSFIYSQDHIINKLIPRLEQLRNQLFVDKPNLYVSYLPSSDPNFGKNNDDPVFGTSVSTLDPLKSELPDTNGVSYRYIVPSSPITVPVKSALTGAVTYETLPPLSGDSVRWYNQQIRLWEEAIRINEQEKYEALMDGTQLIQNYSFSSGIEYQNSATTESTEALEFTFEVGVSANMAIEIGGSVGGVGVGLEMGLSLGLTSGGGFGTENTSSTTFAFTFLDEDVGDFYSVDVRKSKLGYGPIFNIVAGETSCPWEGPDESIYYTSANQPVTLSSGTLHRELVEMKVDGSPTYSQKINVPSNSSATFNLELTNITETNDDYDYGIKVLAETNPNGAILSIDGYSPSTQPYPVAAGSSLNKTLVLQRGSVEYDYDSIAVVVYSLCGDEVVGDTVYVTAHFLPSCSDVTVQYPLNQWVVNNSFNDTLPVIIGGYDINFNGLEEIGLEIKPSSQSSWIGLQNWYKYVATPGPDSLQISQSNANTFYSWILQGIPDGQYDIRVKSSCVLADNQSNVFTGIIDRINPHPFGTPSPADGILDPNDDIYIQLNEPVDIGAMNSYNFDVRGVLNGSDIRHSESLNFDGTSSFARVSGGANLRQRSFTVEFWAKLNTTGIDQTVFSQGTNAAQSMAIGFNSSDEFTFRLGNQTVTSTIGIGTLTDWQHYAVVYDYTNNAAMLYVDGNLVNNGNLNLFFDYQGDGKLAFGKELPANTNFFNGNLHEMRLWNDVRSVSEIVQNLAIELAGNESGLLYNWRMNEIVGAVAEDHVRARNADLFGTTWEVNPNGFAAQFDGMDDYFVINSSTIPITKEMDFTLEFWFRSSQSGVATLFSNGNGDGLQADSLTSWNITKDASGIIHIYHNGLDFVATTQDHFDGNWHHFALVMNRNANLSSYIDGNLEGSAQAINFEQMGSPEMFLGAHGFYIGGSFSVQDFFQGDMDEFRFWNASRKLEQIRRDLRNSMLGDEYGLEAYLPFEDYQLVLGAPIITSSTSDQSENANTITNNGSVTIISQTPTLKLPRPVEAVPFTFSVNNDKIIITPTASSELIEKVTLDITVKNVKDLHGNIMQSPKTWIAYVNKNQVLWQDDEFTFTKTEDEVITFTTNIVNTGGAAKMFTVGGLPSWMTASLTSGTTSPNSSQQITFTIHDGYSVGEYFADVTLTTDFGYDEVLRVNLSVVGTPPNWTVNPANYAYNMAIFGELEIDGIINTNTNSMLGAFIDDSICGVANLQYLPAYDRYEAFLNVYSNNITGDSIRFKIYDATTGFIFVDVTPSILFMENDIQGTVANPITFRASTTIALNIPLNKGWTWFSMPLETNDLSSSTLLTEDLVNTTNDLIKGQVSFDQYASSMGWLGGITAGGGYLNAESYKYFRANRDTLELIGKRIHPDSSIAQINLDQGWNWMGYVSTKVSSLTTALGQLTPTDGDIIKSQYNFAVYDNLNGWIGSLTQMKPGYGYMYKAINATSFNYPISLYYGKSGSYTADDSFNLPQEYTFEAGDYSKTMSVIGISNLCPEAQTDENIILVAYDGDHNVRGWVQGQTIDNEIMFFITVHGNTANEEIYFEYINVLTRQSVPAMGVGLLFQNDQLIGTMSNPMDVVVSEEEVCKLLTPTNVTEMADLGFSTYPNPFNNEISIEFETLVAVNISLRDVLGRTIVNENYTGQGKHTIRIIETLPAGVYTLSLTGDIETNLKLIKN
ncbi:MAG: T9SS type A sorting domain-containing protein [Flavobacteriales bacterium]|nr:T9SS type A sorting domain-containing protein [Flavobacteriales bacterium]